MISFTGSTATGQRVAQLASPLVKRVTLELGGKAPFVVFADADLDACAQGAVVASFMNAGQDCTAATRFYVQHSVKEAFLAKFAALAAKMVVGACASGWILWCMFLKKGEREGGFASLACFFFLLFCFRLFSSFFFNFPFSFFCPPSVSLDRLMVIFL